MVRLKSKLSKVLSFTLILAATNTTLASGIDKLMKFASPNGTLGNTTKAAIINDQQGGYMTGGSVILRAPHPETLNPLIVQTPKFAFDACSGSADFRFGGLSYITANEFSRFFKNVATASGAYAVKMLIKTACPQCEDIMSYLETVARDINSLMMDQCSMAQTIAGGAFNMLTSSNQQKCMMQSNLISSSRDMYEATDKCKTDPDRYGNTGENDELKSLLGNEFNLVWKAINNGNGNHSFLELVMSVSGTIIGRKVNGAYEFTPKPSLVMSNDLLEQYIGVSNGTSKVKLYECRDKAKCLDMNEIDVALSRDDTLYGNVSRILAGLVPKVAKGNSKTLTDEEEAVISFSSIPLISLIEMEIASKAKTQDMLVRISEFVEVVCYDVVTNFLQAMVTKAQAAVEALEYVQISDLSAIREFTDRAEEVKTYLKDAKFTAFKRLQVITQVKERLRNQEKAFEAGFSRIMMNNK